MNIALVVSNNAGWSGACSGHFSAKAGFSQGGQEHGSKNSWGTGTALGVSAAVLIYKLYQEKDK